MQVDFATVLIDVRDNTPLTILKKKKDVETEEDLTGAYAAAEALGSVLEDEHRTLSQKDKLTRGKLIERIFIEKSPLEITVEEANLIRERIGKVYPPLVVVAMEKLLDPK